MKQILALATLAFVVLVLDEKTRQIVGEVQDAYDEAGNRVRTAVGETRRTVEKQPLSSLLIAGTAGFLLRWVTVRSGRGH